ncbi:toll/interleukin-1 receptor domain-containing protein [Thalassomonas viridans]|uniref:Toll/interleukin-1 receptor domain-containing protein n=1 Tax=Thalassomonas viridans TaxID=137584 RepID=A0AAE9Z8A8_9GAMM|nr:toll/interleukin-1 receptor domain-containing protein [Thalassomonas viridans]WDE07133.1 toll/interleukin-1 receptor domain-containing protein [Thalassomonas viridans]
MSGEIFVSYRWGEQSKAAAWQLYSALQQKLGKDRIVIDVRSEFTGENIRTKILQDLKAAKILLVVIHPDWIEGIPQLHHEDNYIKLEIEAAIELGLRIIPVLLEGAEMPGKEVLPDSLFTVADTGAFAITASEAYDQAVNRLALTLKAHLPGKTVALLEWFADKNSAGNLVFGLMIAAAFLLFISRMLDIHMLYFTTSVRTDLAGEQADRVIEREGGVLMAWNWSFVILVVIPAMTLLFSNTLRQGRELLEHLRIRKMLFFVGPDNLMMPMASRGLWDNIVRPTAAWFRFFVVLGVILAIVQWYQYSGQWYWQAYSRELFLRVSTGEDWHIAWALGLDNLAHSGPYIISFSLVMYLFYTISSVITYSYYAFLFNFFSELSQLTSSAGARGSQVLKMDVNDRESGGLAAFRQIQSCHAQFCLWSLVAMYLMALRNAYLPHVCYLPQELLAYFASPAQALEQCGSMGRFTANIYLSFQSVILSLLRGQPDFSLLFFTYSEPNLFILGSLFYMILIGGFFYLISSRMRSIVELSRRHAGAGTGNRLLSELKSETRKVLVILMTGALSIVFLNLGPLVLCLAMIWLFFRRKAH